MSFLQNMEKIDLKNYFHMVSCIVPLKLDNNDSLENTDLNQFINIYSDFLDYMNTLYTVKHKYIAGEYRNLALRLLRKKETVTLAYIANNTILGFVNYHVNALCQHMRINEIFVLEKYRKIGIGTKLFQYIENEAYNDPFVKVMELSVNENNELAKKFYLNYGFKYR